MLFATPTVHYMPLAKHLYYYLMIYCMFALCLSCIMIAIVKYVMLLIICLFGYLLSVLKELYLSLMIFYLNQAVTNSLNNFITFHGVVLWNNLAINIEELSTLSKFKLKLVSTFF